MLSRQLYQPKWEFTFHTCYMSPLCPFRQLRSSHRMVLTCIFLRTSDGRHLLPILLLSIYFSGKGSVEIYFQIKKFKVFLISEFWTFLSFVHYVVFASLTWFVFLSVLNSLHWFSSFDDHPTLFGHYWSWNIEVPLRWLYSFQSPHGCSRSFTFLFGICYFLPPRLGLSCWGSQSLKNTCRHKFIPHASGCPGAHCHSDS